MSQAAVDALIALLDLEPIEVNIFRGASPPAERQRVFGGQVAGQALVAAARTVEPDSRVHSLHAYFLRPGDTRIPILYMVDRIRDGLSFVTRRVTAVQHGRAIFSLSASFQVPEDGFEHSEQMPEVPGPRDPARPCGSGGRSWPRRATAWPTRPRASSPSTCPSTCATATGRSPTASGPCRRTSACG